MEGMQPLQVCIFFNTMLYFSHTMTVKPSL